MADDLKYRPVRHNHEKFLKKVQKCAGFKKAYDELEDQYSLARKIYRDLEIPPVE